MEQKKLKPLPEQKSKIFWGRVFHKRKSPKQHILNYKMCSFLIDLDEAAILERDIKYFSMNKFNWVSFWPGDFGGAEYKRGFFKRKKVDKTALELKEDIRLLLQKNQINIEKGRVQLLCYPRVLGYSFNPLATYFCSDSQGILVAIIYEVSNTFGQRHSYIIPIQDKKLKSHIEHDLIQTTISHQCDKELYVSPFMSMDCQYRFLIRSSYNSTSEKLLLLIQQNETGKPILTASFNGTATLLNSKNIKSFLRKFPFMTFKVITAIHWEALLLWLKDTALIKRPPPPENPYSLINSIKKTHSKKYCYSKSSGEKE